MELTKSDIMEGRPCDRKCSKCNKIIGENDGYSGQSNNDIVTCLSCTYLHQPMPKEPEETYCVCNTMGHLAPCNHCENTSEEDLSKKETTDKLPEAGKRYKHRFYDKTGIIKEIKHYVIIDTEDGLPDEEINTRWFGDTWEELPDQQPTTEKSSAVNKKDPWWVKEHQENRVRETLKEVKRELKEWEDDCLLSSNKYSQKPLDREGVISTFNHVQNLVNALEARHKHDKPEGKE